MTDTADQPTGEPLAHSRQQRLGLSPMPSLPPDLEQELDRLDQEFWLPTSKLEQIVHRFRSELNQGLAAHAQNIAMHQTWVHSLPSGNERGTYLTLDLGGTNLRVSHVTLHGDNKPRQSRTELKQTQYRIPSTLKTGTAPQLWDFIATKLAAFIRETGLGNYFSPARPIPLGFTFSYPCTQARLDHAELQTWTKGFDIAGVEGTDVAASLRAAISTRRLPVDLVCVVNDTVGALVASAYSDPETVVGAVFGTGCNAAYMAGLDRIGKMSRGEREAARKRGPKMAVNCEYGAFDNAHAVLPRTALDREIDARSPRPGEQAFEKMAAGLYLGELFRLVLLDLARRGRVFSRGSAGAESLDLDATKLTTPYALDTALLSALETDTRSDLAASTALLHSTLALPSPPTHAEAALARAIAVLISVRGARLCACGVAAICQNEGIERGHVAADGSVANKQPGFRGRWGAAMGEILGWEEEASPIRLVAAEDGSGVGCAIVAAMEVERRAREGAE